MVAALPEATQNTLDDFADAFGADFHLSPVTEDTIYVISIRHMDQPDILRMTQELLNE
jgi:hypothetical protein